MTAQQVAIEDKSDNTQDTMHFYLESNSASVTPGGDIGPFGVLIMQFGDNVTHSEYREDELQYLYDQYCLYSEQYEQQKNNSHMTDNIIENVNTTVEISI